MSTGLSARLRSATHDLHARVERTGVMRQLLKGEIDRAGYARLLRQLQAIYAALEDALARHATHAQVAPMCRPALFRSAALAADLAVLQSAGADAAKPLAPAAVRYARHLGELAEHAPERLAAHAYVRYLGDLSGGQIVARLLAARLQLDRTAGLRFYDFGSTDEIAAHGRALRAGLDAIGADGVAAEAVVDEACLAFEWHAQLFEELADAAPLEQATSDVN